MRKGMGVRDTQVLQTVSSATYYDEQRGRR
jgi:hypothetical protein